MPVTDETDLRRTRDALQRTSDALESALEVTRERLASDPLLAPPPELARDATGRFLLLDALAALAYAQAALLTVQAR